MAKSSLNSSIANKKTSLKLPLAIEKISAGFPSPAEDYLDIGIDLNEQLIRHPESTFFMRVSGHSMTNNGINNGDLLIIDRSIDPRPGQIVIAVLDGCFTVKKLTRTKTKLYLEANCPNYPPIDISNYETVQIWGTAIYCIHNLNKISKSL